MSALSIQCCDWPTWRHCRQVGQSQHWIERADISLAGAFGPSLIIMPCHHIPLKLSTIFFWPIFYQIGTGTFSNVIFSENQNLLKTLGKIIVYCVNVTIHVTFAVTELYYLCPILLHQPKCLFEVCDHYIRGLAACRVGRSKRGSFSAVIGRPGSVIG